MQLRMVYLRDAVLLPGGQTESTIHAGGKPGRGTGYEMRFKDGFIHVTSLGKPEEGTAMIPLSNVKCMRPLVEVAVAKPKPAKETFDAPAS